MATVNADETSRTAGKRRGQVLRDEDLRDENSRDENLRDVEWNRAHLIGWRELVAFPEWGIKGVEAKIDTGARTSALHVEDITRLKGDRVRFHVILSRDNPKARVEAEAPIVRTARIRSSTGHLQVRYVVRARIRVGPHKRKIEVSLVRRHEMLCRMLLGRTALDGFLIDCGLRYVYGEPEKRARAKKKRKKLGSENTGEKKPRKKKRKSSS